MEYIQKKKGELFFEEKLIDVITENSIIVRMRFENIILKRILLGSIFFLLFF